MGDKKDSLLHGHNSVLMFLHVFDLEEEEKILVVADVVSAVVDFHDLQTDISVDPAEAVSQLSMTVDSLVVFAWIDFLLVMVDVEIFGSASYYIGAQSIPSLSAWVVFQVVVFAVESLSRSSE